MNRTWKTRVMPLVLLALLAGAAGSAVAQTADEKGAEPTKKGFFDFIKAGGLVGYTIIAMSIVSAGLVIDSFVHIKQAKLLPPEVLEESEDLARKGRFSQIVTLCKANGSMICRIIGNGLSQGSLGLPAVRQAMQDQGAKELHRLNQRVGYMGFIGSIGPMLGLLGTVLGMVGSFNILGTSKGSARPDELAVGISYALVTTCEGLIVAIPMMFFHNFFRDRVAGIGQESSGVCERLVRLMAQAIESRSAARPVQQPGADQDPGGESAGKDSAARG